MPVPSRVQRGEGSAAMAAMTDHKTRFLAELAPTVQRFSFRDGLPASVLLAQAILESDWGRSTLAREHNNFFGIKARRRPNGAATPDYATTEYAGGLPRREKARFAHFDTLDACLADYARLLSLPRYARARAVAANPFAFAVELQRCGYATDPRYARKLALLMRRYKLTHYDVPAPAECRQST
ncbi:MAG: glycoside hydrolase family 73 protein [Candidatus Acidiferrales bacterium]